MGLGSRKNYKERNGSSSRYMAGVHAKGFENEMENNSVNELLHKVYRKIYYSQRDVILKKDKDEDGRVNKANSRVDTKIYGEKSIFTSI